MVVHIKHSESCFSAGMGSYSIQQHPDTDPHEYNVSYNLQLSTKLVPISGPCIRHPASERAHSCGLAYESMCHLQRITHGSTTYSIPAVLSAVLSMAHAQHQSCDADMWPHEACLCDMWPHEASLCDRSCMMGSYTSCFALNPQMKSRCSYS